MPTVCLRFVCWTSLLVVLEKWLPIGLKTHHLVLSNLYGGLPGNACFSFCYLSFSLSYLFFCSSLHLIAIGISCVSHISNWGSRVCTIYRLSRVNWGGEFWYCTRQEHFVNTGSCSPQRVRCDSLDVLNLERYSQGTAIYGYLPCNSSQQNSWANYRCEYYTEAGLILWNHHYHMIT